MVEGTINKDFYKKEHERSENLKVGKAEVKRPREGCFGVMATSEVGLTGRGWNFFINTFGIFYKLRYKQFDQL